MPIATRRILNKMHLIGLAVNREFRFQLAMLTLGLLNSSSYYICCYNILLRDSHGLIRTLNRFEFTSILACTRRKFNNNNTGDAMFGWKY